MGSVGLLAEAEPASQTSSSTAAPVTEEPPAKAPAERPKFFTFGRKILLSLLGLGTMSAIIGGTMQGTHSAFTASVSNAGNTFAAGTLTMTNTVTLNGGGGTCR